MGKRGPEPAGKMASLPTPPAKRPGPPPGMTPRARARWLEIVKGYSIDHFKPGDLPLLRAYCEAHDKAVRMQKQIDADGDFVMSANQTLKAHPAHAIKLASETLMGNLAVKLRLCANSRISRKDAEKEKPGMATTGRKMFGAS